MHTTNARRVAARINGKSHAKPHCRYQFSLAGQAARRGVRRTDIEGVCPLDAWATPTPQVSCKDATPQDAADPAELIPVRHGGRAGC